MSNINVNNLTPLLGSGSSVSVSGSLVVKNDVTIGGHLYIGDQDTDSVTFSAEVSSSVIPDANITYDLGSSAKKWNQIYLNSLVTHHITASGNISASGTGINGTGSFHHVTVNGNVTSSGTASFEGGFFSTNGTGSLAYVSVSGDMDIAGHISGSRISASAGLEVDHTGSFRYISSSGDLTASGTGSFGGGIDAFTATGSFAYVQSEGDVSASGTGSFMDLFVDDMVEIQGDVNLHGNISGSGTATASFGHVSASGDISSSTSVYARQFYVGSEGALLALGGSGVGGANVVKLGGASSVTQLHGLSIDVTGSISASSDMTIVGDISSSGRISASGGFETDGSSNFGSISMSGAIVTSGHISASRVSASAGFEADTLSTSSFGNISASGNISTSAHMHAVQYFTDSLIFATGDQASNTVKLGGASSVTRIHGAGIDVTGSISMSGVLHTQLNGNGALPTIDNDTVAIFQRNLPGNSSAAVSIIGHAAGESILKLGDTDDEDIGRIRYQHGDNSMDFHTNNTQQMSIDSSGNLTGVGTGSFYGGIDCLANNLNATGSFGYISASGDISTSTNMHAVQYFTDSLIFATGDQASNTVKLGGAASVTRLHGLSIDITGSISASTDISSSGTGSFTGGIEAVDATGSFGYISCSQDISSSATVFGEAIIAGAGNSIIKGNIKFEGAVKRPLKSITADTVLDATTGVLADAGKTIVLNKADGATVTLPAALGTGASYTFFVGTAITSNNYIIKVADATDTFIGAVHMMDADDDSQTSVTAKGTDDTLTMNGGTTGGGLLGDTLTFTDIAANKYVVQGNIIVPAGSNPADPFSATV